MIGDLWIVAGGVAAIFAIVGGLYGAYELIRRKMASRPYTKVLSVFAGTNTLRDDLLKLKGRTIDLDTVMDFSVWNEFSNR